MREQRANIAQLLQDTVLGGAAMGLAAQRSLREHLGVHVPSVLFLDFAGVHCATASFLREAVFGLRDAMDRAGTPCQIVLLNPCAQIRDELGVLSQVLGLPVVVANALDDRCPEVAAVIGSIDPAQQETLSRVLALGTATASALARSEGGDNPTKWNNRLAALADKGLLVESKRGREKEYRPVVKGLTYGNRLH